MKRVLFVALLTCILVVSFSTANATCTSYRDNVLLSQPIGAYEFDTIAPNTAQTYGLQVTAGHSYTFTAIEYYQVGTGTGVFDYNAATAPILAYADINCTTTLATTNASAVDPALSSSNPGGTNGIRFSFVAPSTGMAMFTITNSDQNDTNPIYMAAADTTMICPRWSTWSGYYTSYKVMNTSGATVSGTLSFLAPNGSVLASANFSLAPGAATAIESDGTGGLVPVVAPSQIGSAIITHTGTVGSLMAD